MKKRQYLILSFAFLLILMFVVSCAPARRPGDPAAPENAPRQTRFFPRMTPRRPNATPMIPGPVPVPRRAVPGGQTPMPRTNMNAPAAGEGDMTQRAQEISRSVARQNEIESATCVITGNTALVGVQFDDQYRGQLTNQIKEKVDKVVRDEDDRITRVVVTADPDLVTRIENMFRQVGQGRPISGFTNEVGELINRIQPK